MALHGASPYALHVPYLVPSENGTRSQVDWLEILFDTGNGPHDKDDAGAAGGQGDEGCQRLALSVECSQPFCFSAQMHSTEKLQYANHFTELDNHDASTSFESKRDSDPLDYSSSNNSLWVNIDPYLMGVGGDDSWTACVHPPYLLPSNKIYEYNLLFSARYVFKK